MLKIQTYQNLFYNFFNFIIIAPSPPSIFEALEILETYFSSSGEDWIYSGTEYLNLLKSFETYVFSSTLECNPLPVINKISLKPFSTHKGISSLTFSLASLSEKPCKSNLNL